MKIDPMPKCDWTEKVWGRTRCIAMGPSFEVHELEIKAGGFCSRHRHRKWNLFHVSSGSLEIEVFGHGDECMETPEWVSIHEGNDQMRVAPGTWHRFRAKTDCLVTEVYWVDQIDPRDIEREDEGGIGFYSEEDRLRFVRGETLSNA